MEAQRKSMPAAVGFSVALAGCGALNQMLFVPSSSVANRETSSSALRGAASVAQAPQPAQTPSGSSALGACVGVAGIAGAVAAATQRRHGRRRMNARQLSAVTTKAMGSIQAFKVFGPDEDKFEIEPDKVLGVGGQGTVYQCHKQSDPDTKMAVKTIAVWRLHMDPGSEAKIAEIRKEVDVLNTITNHPNVCKSFGCYDVYKQGSSEVQYIMMVMEKIQGGELAGYIKDGKDYLEEDVARTVFKQTAEGLKYIHDNGVVHRDLKPENILVCSEELTTDSQVKLIDFGVAKATNNTYLKSCVGTTEIMAPELVSAKLMLAPKGTSQKLHGPYTFKSLQEDSPGFGIVTQRPDGKGAMAQGIEPGGQAEKFNVEDGWAVYSINGINITEMPFVKDFNAVGAGTVDRTKGDDASTQNTVTAITEILGGLDGPFDLVFVELPKREFSAAVDMWSLGVTLFQMLGGMKPFADEAAIVSGEYDMAPLSHCSDDAKDLIQNLLKMDPDERLTVDQVLAHPFVTKA